MKKKREFVENEHYASILETIDVITEFQEAAMNEMQTIEWKKAIQNPEFMALRKRREQLKWLFSYFKNVNHEYRCSHQLIAEKFGISRQAAENQVKKAIQVLICCIF